MCNIMGIIQWQHCGLNFFHSGARQLILSPIRITQSLPVISALWEAEAGRSQGQEMEIILPAWQNAISTKIQKLAGHGGTCP